MNWKMRLQPTRRIHALGRVTADPLASGKRRWLACPPRVPSLHTYRFFV